MQVPHATKWQKETDKLRRIALDCSLTEEIKWGKPVSDELQAVLNSDAALKAASRHLRRDEEILQLPCLRRQAGQHAAGARRTVCADDPSGRGFNELPR